jgi:hypothetical protein
MKHLLFILFVSFSLMATGQDQGIFLSTPVITPLTNTSSGSIASLEQQQVKIDLPRNGLNTSERTFSFWIKLERQHPNVTVTENRASIASFGDFALLIKRDNDRYNMLMEHDEQQFQLVELRDEQWHFVSIACSFGVIKYSLDGEEYSLVTDPPGNIVSNENSIKWFGPESNSKLFRSITIDNFSVWNNVRSHEQVLSEMRYYPRLSPITPNLIAHYRFNGPASTLNSIKGDSPVVLEGAKLTKPIAQNKNITEGVYYTLQNYSDLKYDIYFTARRRGLRMWSQRQSRNVTRFGYERMPLDLSASKFFFQLKPIAGNQYELIGDSAKLQVELRTVGTSGHAAGTEIGLGTNVFQIYQPLLGYLKISNNKKTFQWDKNPFLTEYSLNWFFQPMSLVPGYHIPVLEDPPTPASNSTNTTASIEPIPTIRTLKTKFGTTIYGSNVISEFNLLNTRLIVENMVNAMKPAKRCSNVTNAEVFIMNTIYENKGQYDNYPHFPLQALTFGGESGGGASSRTCLVNEEITCVYDPENDLYREWDHITHEFGHVMDLGCNLMGDTIYTVGWRHPTLHPNPLPRECFTICIQAFFNNNYSYGNIPLTKQGLKYGLKRQWNTLTKTLNDYNDWTPPRNMRHMVYARKHDNRDKGGIQRRLIMELSNINLKAYDPSQKNESKDLIVSERYHNYLEHDSIWGLRTFPIEKTNPIISSVGNLGMPIKQEIRINQGQIKYYNGLGQVTDSFGLATPNPNARVVLGDRGSDRFVRIIDEDYNILWRIPLKLQFGNNYASTYYLYKNSAGSTNISSKAGMSAFKPMWLKNNSTDRLQINNIELQQIGANGNLFTIEFKDQFGNIIPIPPNQPYLNVLNLTIGEGIFFDITFSPPPTPAPPAGTGTLTYQSKLVIKYKEVNEDRVVSFTVYGSITP